MQGRYRGRAGSEGAQVPEPESPVNKTSSEFDFTQEQGEMKLPVNIMRVDGFGGDDYEAHFADGSTSAPYGTIAEAVRDVERQIGRCCIWRAGEGDVLMTGRELTPGLECATA
jgi:hypothetical protein